MLFQDFGEYYYVIYVNSDVLTIRSKKIINLL